MPECTNSDSPFDRFRADVEREIQAQIDDAVAEARRAEARYWLDLFKRYLEAAARDLSFTLMHRRDLQKEATARIVAAGLGEDILNELLGIERLMGNDCARWTHEAKEALRQREDGGQADE